MSTNQAQQIVDALTPVTRETMEALTRYTFIDHLTGLLFCLVLIGFALVGVFKIKKRDDYDSDAEFLKSILYAIIVLLVLAAFTTVPALIDPKGAALHKIFSK